MWAPFIFFILMYIFIYNKLCSILGGNRRSYTAAQMLEMISGMDSDVALTDDEHENDDAD